MSDEMFVSALEVDKVVDDNSAVYYVHRESGNVVEWAEEINYKFKLSLFTERILEWIENDRTRIEPVSARQFVLSLLKQPLSDISISRDKNRVGWAIDVPQDSSQTIYVWLDALVNYLTACEFPDTSSATFRNMWPPDVHFVGIDIIKFHAIYWPAFLMAAGLELPKKILCHLHWTIDNVKMSKSKGNVVDPMTAGEELTCPGLRYFLLRQGVLDHYCNYNKELAKQYINADLANDIGNCLHRATNKHLNPMQTYPAFHRELFSSNVEEKQFHAGVEEFRYIESIRSLPNLVDNDAEAFRFFKSLFLICEGVRASNMIIQRHQLWRLDRGVAEQQAFVETLLHCVFEGLRVCGILLQPFIPSLAERLLDHLAIPTQSRSWEDAKNSFVELEGASHPLVGKPLGERKMFFKRLQI